MITLSDVSFSHGTRTLFRGVNLRIVPGSRVALVGANGTGKTTLLEIITGERLPDTGTVSRGKDTSVGILEQEIAELAGRTVLEEVLDGAEATHVGRRLVEMSERAAHAEGAEQESFIDEYGRMQTRFEALGGYEVESDARRILAGLGFPEERVDRDVGQLSGGWMMRVALARLLLAKPDVLLLDEPTNHLDLESIRWLEGFLRGYEGAIVLVSHDRDFMNAVAERIVEIAHGTATEYVGDFASFVEQRELRIAQLEAAARNQQRRVEEIERFIERFRYKNTLATRVQSRVKMLEKMDRIEVPDEDRRRMKLAIPEPPRSGRVVVELEGIAKSYGEHTVYDGVDLVLERGQKVALVGPNGAGKSTLLRIIAGAETIDRGSRTLGHNVNVAYYAQHTVEALHLQRTVLEELTSVVDTRKVNPRSVLGAFLFSGEDVDKRVKVLSGGERARLALAKLVADPVNLLCLDEPTNHLDIASRDVVEDAIDAYGGTVVLITHDRHLIRSVADTIVEVRDGEVIVHAGNYDDYVEQRHEADGASCTDAVELEASTRTNRDEDAGRKRAEAERRNRLHRATKQLRTRVAEVEAALSAAEAEVAEVTRLLADPSIYGDDDEVKQLVRRHGEAKDRAGELMATWERLSLELERATAAAEQQTVPTRS